MFLDGLDAFVRTQLVAGRRAEEKLVSRFSQKQMSKTRHHLCALLQMVW